MLTSKNYTTGRGGQGNIVSNDSAETARIAQDVDVPGIALPENDVHTGRGKQALVGTKARAAINSDTGGAGNARYLTEDEKKTAQDHNKNLRSASFSKDKGFLKNLGDKAKELVKGDKNEGSAVN